MAGLTELAGQTLKWGKSSTAKGEYELSLGEQVIAKFRFHSSFGPFPTAESLYGCWMLKRAGSRFWNKLGQISIYPLGSDSKVAEFNYDEVLRRGTLEFSDARKLLVTFNLLRTKLEFNTEAGEVLLKFRRRGFFYPSADVKIQHQATTFSDLPMVIVLGWYLILMVDTV